MIPVSRQRTSVSSLTRCLPQTLTPTINQTINQTTYRSAHQSSSQSNKRPKNTHGSNEYRKKRHLRRMEAIQDELTLRQAAAIGATVTVRPVPSTNQSTDQSNSQSANQSATQSSSIYPPIAEDITVGRLQLSAPRVCMGCGAEFQTQFEHIPGFIDQSVVDRFMHTIKRAVGKHAKVDQTIDQSANDDPSAEQPIHQSINPSIEQSINESVKQSLDEEIDDEAADEALDIEDESIDNIDAQLAEAALTFNESDSQSIDQSANQSIDPSLEQPVRHFSSDAEWQDALRRGEISESDLAAHHAIEIITPAQLKEELKAMSLIRNNKHQTARASLTESDEQLLNLSINRYETISLQTKPLRCARCYQLSHYGYTHGQVSSVAATDFRALLRSRFIDRSYKSNDGSGQIIQRSSVIIYLVDLFDLAGSVVPDIRSLIGGRNPVILVANKRDLLPAKYGENRMRAWLKAEAARHGIAFQSVQLVSAKTGEGVPGLMRKARELAASNQSIGQRDIYVIGATNAGKSSLINKMIDMKYIATKGQFVKQNIYKEALDSVDPSIDHPIDSAPNSVAAPLSEGRATASSFPGTTLGLVGFPLIPSRDGNLYDTPGVLHNNQLSPQLRFDEQRALLPSRSIVPVTYRVSPGQSILIGGFARIDLVEGRPMFFTAFVSQVVTVHVTQTEKLDADDGQGMNEFFAKHAGGLVSPPFTFERYEALGLSKAQRVLFEMNGQGWEQACDDIVLSGVGWVSVTGVGQAKVRVMIAGGLKPRTREPIMPFEARTSTQKFHGHDRRAPLRQHQKSASRSVYGNSSSFHTLPSQSSLTFRRSLHVASTPSTSSFSARSFSTSRGRDRSPPPSDDIEIDPIVLNRPNASVAEFVKSSNAGVLISSLPQPIRRPDWKVYKSMLQSHRDMVVEEYRKTPHYVARPKGPWRIAPSGESTKLYRPQKRVKRTKGLRVSERIGKRRLRQATAARSESISTEEMD